MRCAEPMTTTPAERKQLASIASNISWARTEDRSRRTAPAREAAMARFEREVDPEGLLPAVERARRAANLRTAYFRNLALKSARVRKKAA